MQNMYDKISPFFTLLYIFDIENVPIAQLQLLHKNLQEQKPIEPNLQPIYSRLQQASKRNIADRLKQKRQKKKMEDKISVVKQNTSKIVRQQCKIKKLEPQYFQDYSQINQSTMQDINIPNQFRQVEKKFGTIYNGELIITLQLSDLIKVKKIKVQFQIDSKKRQSSISKQTLTQLGLNSTNPSLLVDSRKQKFQIQNQNRLGLSFLQKYNIILECNYRPECSSFELIYTQ